MTIEGNHAICDGCRAVTPLDSERYHRWEVREMQNGPDVHLCEVCQERPE